MTAASVGLLAGACGFGIALTDLSADWKDKRSKQRENEWFARQLKCRKKELNLHTITTTKGGGRTLHYS